MESSIASFCESMASFCNHIETSCDALKQSIHRHPIPLDSASLTFVQCLNRRVATASSELNVLESLSLETVSFEELLGHCNEVYKNNQENLLHLQERLKSLGYVSECEINDEDEALDDLSSPLGLDLTTAGSNGTRSVIKSLDSDEALLSSSLKDLGFSDLCLDSLASKGKGKIDDPDVYLLEPLKAHGLKEEEADYPALVVSKASTHLDLDAEEMDINSKPVKSLSPVMKLSKDDYEDLPSYMKGLAPWEFLMGQTITTPTQQRWLARLLGYNFQVEYKRDVENLAANGLSRQFEDIQANVVSQPLPLWVDTVIDCMY